MLLRSSTDNFKSLIEQRNKLNLRGVNMKQIVLIFGVIFLILTFIGGGYVLINHGQVNAGYAVVPGIWAMICFGFYRSRKRD